MPCSFNVLQRLQLRRVKFHLPLRRQTVMRKSFRGAASVIKTPPFVVTPVTETCTATAVSGSLKYCQNHIFVSVVKLVWISARFVPLIGTGCHDPNKL